MRYTWRVWRVPWVVLTSMAMTASQQAPMIASPSGVLNALWNTYGDQGGHWTGGDRTTSIPLPDGRTAWLFSDTFLGTVNPDHSRPPGSPMPRNTMVVQEKDGTLGATLHGGTPEHPRALVEGTSNEHLWVADGTVVNGALSVLYNRYEKTGNGALDVRSTGTSLATFALPDLKLDTVTPLPLSPDVAWGSEILDDGEFTYVYGAEHRGHEPKQLLIARTHDLSKAWEFWTGAGWSPHESDAAPALSGIGTAFSVTRAGTGFVLVTVDGTTPFSRKILAYPATSPTGPFGAPRVLYEAPEGATPERRIIVYDATTHPQLNVLSYNVNSLDLADNLADARIYRPRFLDLELNGGADE
ncbi:DUF5005 domain-containing protein [Lentzea sp. NBRC 105346]|uniref:DUF5005 domain-containing protein n=1 Tax=Lentzea sp. NBRC 105346 TaxID=3032205 RepID=UPI00255764A9|nr:DUF5005 domain-containing protein [Lentzea sp. NBRC 105346]